MLPPLDLSHHYSYITTKRQPSGIKGLYKYFFIPGIANLAGGLPNASYFPYDTLEASVATPQRFQPSNEDPAVTSEQRLSPRIIVPRESRTADTQKKIDLTTALQYATASGLPPMASFVREFTRQHLHPNVPYAGGPETILTNGATDGFSKVVEAFTNPWHARVNAIGDRQGILCEEYVFMNSISIAKPRGLNIVAVAMDAQGMLAYGIGGLAEKLENWNFRLGRRPHLLYTVTVGQNPTGGTLSVERRKEIYDLCQKYDIIIVEDDPYWNLQYPSAAVLEAQYRGAASEAPPKRNYNAHGKSSGYEFLDSLVPSYLSLDIDGRVVRLDTFSKTIAPGCRMGWITAQPAIIEKITMITETSTQAPSGFVQAMVSELILGQQTDDDSTSPKDQSWQMDGWVRWLEGLRGGYERRMQAMCSVLEEGKSIISSDTMALDAHSDDENAWAVVDKAQMYDFSWPTGGMFIWIKANLNQHPLRRQYEEQKISKALWVHLMQEPYLCLLAPGSVFAPNVKSLAYSFPFYRLCFAAVPEAELRDIALRLVEGFRAFWKRKNLDDLLGGDEDAAIFITQKNDDIGGELGTCDKPTRNDRAKMATQLESLGNAELAEEIEAINAIYEPDTVTVNSTPAATSTGNSTLDLGSAGTASPLAATVRLQVPEHPHLSFILGFDASYPDSPPKVLGTASTASRGEGKVAVDVLEEILGRTYQPGAVCLFDVINEAVEAFQELSIGGGGDEKTKDSEETEEDTLDLKPEDIASLSLKESFGLDSPPDWILSDVVTEKKSVFVGRAAHVTSLEQAQAYLDYLLATEKKVASATHNISAWRIRQQKPSGGKGESAEMIVQDCDDDGETAAGGRLLHLMQLMDVWDVVVLVTRWYGGIHLGPDRFRIINAVGRDALLKGGFVKESTAGGNEKGKKKGKK
ncbi:aromatic amino acid aminotransferase [Aspergillus avenaceus]|uniref:Aromatic amino acid aminotransferase n=1 Tax=Aspergillus avenaceus TaxID=36643 RepID=A0A5N6TL12_ASPAV|nr:aromatic amino acid aminotransferase [Aspergillus avenaceus]